MQKVSYTTLNFATYIHWRLSNLYISHLDANGLWVVILTRLAGAPVEFVKVEGHGRVVRE